jgi:hypothetical protein
MKTIKTVKLKATKTATKVPATKTPAAGRPSKPSPKAEPAKAPAKNMTGPRREITSDLIAVRAFIIWEQQGRPQGNDVANWLLAERQLKQEIQSFTA